MPFKLEYRKAGGPWETQICGSLSSLSDWKRRLIAQGFEVRCINSLGQDLFKVGG